MTKADVCILRVDLAEVHAWEARRAFVETVARGESGAGLPPLDDSDLIMCMYAAHSSSQLRRQTTGRQCAGVSTCF